MIIVGDNLKGLINQHNIVEDINSCFDNTSISLRLDNNVIRINPPAESVFTYEDEIPNEWVEEEYIQNNEYLVLSPQSSVLACSFETVNIPIGYFGFLQTKGSLARLFVSIHCCDPQIEPGFNGKITFEIINNSNLKIKIKPRQNIGDLFIFKTSTKQVKGYDGRYNNSDKPTIQKPK